MTWKKKEMKGHGTAENEHRQIKRITSSFIQKYVNHLTEFQTLDQTQQIHIWTGNNSYPQGP